MAEKERLTSAERSAKAKEAWARRKARAAEEAAMHGNALEGFAPEGAVVGEKTVHMEPTGKGEVRIVHFLKDGFTVMGKVWYRGQEVSIAVGTSDWEMTVDRNGDSWLDMDESTQITKYGEVAFRPGPWPTKGAAVLMSEEEYLQALSESDAEAIKRYEKQKQRLSAPPGVTVAV